MVESSLYKGPIYFDCYSNFAVSLTDKTVLQTLELDIETSGYNMLEGAQLLVIVYRIYYKLMKTTLEPQALVESPKVELIPGASIKRQGVTSPNTNHHNDNQEQINSMIKMKLLEMDRVKAVWNRDAANKIIVTIMKSENI
jgi:hypothetical protein